MGLALATAATWESVVLVSAVFAGALGLVKGVSVLRNGRARGNPGHPSPLCGEHSAQIASLAEADRKHATGLARLDENVKTLFESREKADNERREETREINSKLDRLLAAGKD